MHKVSFVFVVSENEALNAKGVMNGICKNESDYNKRNIAGLLCQRLAMKADSIQVRMKTSDDED